MHRVKICGIQTAGELEMSVAAGADAVGFVVEYPDPVPWNLDRDQASRLVKRVPPFVSTVLVTTGSVEEVVDRATAVRPDAVQLHGEESPATVDAIAAELDTAGIQTVKAVPITPTDGRDRRTVVREFASTGVDGIILDAEADDRNGGGTGKTVPWELARQIVADASVPVVLAGGLTPDNVAEAIATVDPYGVDVMSGVERADHRKDPERIEAFVGAVPK